MLSESTKVLICILAIAIILCLMAWEARKIGSKEREDKYYAERRKQKRTVSDEQSDKGNI